MFYTNDEDDSLQCERDTNEPQNESWDDYEKRMGSGINKQPVASVSDGLTSRTRLNPKRHIRNMER